jgi:hypothetical protein
LIVSGEQDSAAYSDSWQQSIILHRNRLAVELLEYVSEYPMRVLKVFSAIHQPALPKPLCKGAQQGRDRTCNIAKTKLVHYQLTNPEDSGMVT